MIQVLEFIFQDFIHFAGTVILISVLGEASGNIFKRR